MMSVYDCLTPWAVVINQFAQHSCGDIYASPLANDSFSFFEYLPFFLKTMLLEFPIYYFFLRKAYRLDKILLINFLINLATHQIIFLAMPSVFIKLDFNYYQYLMIAEIFAPTVEALLLRFAYKLNWKTAILASVLANLFSWTVGIYWRQLK